nr:DUF6421 family protein [Tsukamurella sp. PLM1]
MARHVRVRLVVRRARPGSVWAEGRKALPLDGEPRALVDLVLPDEFPLNVFYEALRRKMRPVLESVRGITAAGPASTSREVTA